LDDAADVNDDWEPVKDPALEPTDEEMELTRGEERLDEYA
jgi:hypothetical protein